MMKITKTYVFVARLIVIGIKHIGFVLELMMFGAKVMMVENKVIVSSPSVMMF